MVQTSQMIVRPHRGVSLKSLQISKKLNTRTHHIQNPAQLCTLYRISSWLIASISTDWSLRELHAPASSSQMYFTLILDTRRYFHSFPSSPTPQNSNKKLGRRSPPRGTQPPRATIPPPKRLPTLRPRRRTRSLRNNARRVLRPRSNSPAPGRHTG
jgi:hypothetical protein